MPKNDHDFLMGRHERKPSQRTGTDQELTDRDTG